MRGTNALAVTVHALSQTYGLSGSRRRCTSQCGVIPTVGSTESAQVWCRRLQPYPVSPCAQSFWQSSFANRGDDRNRRAFASVRFSCTLQYLCTMKHIPSFRSLSAREVGESSTAGGDWIRFNTVINDDAVRLICIADCQYTIPGTCVQYPGLQGGGALGDASTPGPPAGSIAASAHGGTYSHVAVAGRA